MRFTAGLIVGIVIGKPVAKAFNEHLTPPVRRKIANGIIRIYNRIGESLDRLNEEAAR
jgi:hypothetical protein